ncbi:MAG: insulinase family protein, partial [Hydrocarboniphaga effusa]|nr:insulinase family protein [Hydrocarboniphaga effusa]
REGKHWSYGAGSGLANSIGPRLFSASASVQRDKTAESMAEILKELQGVAGRKPFAAREIAAAQDSLTLSLPGANETSDQVAGSITNLVLYGLPDDYYDSLVGKVRALTQKDLAAAAKRMVYPDALTWLVIGDLAKIEAPVRKLGFGEVKVLDADGTELR